jgi:hypothetical protein
MIRAAQRLSLSYWDSLVKEYFASQAIMKFTLWKDNQRNEAKPFGWVFLVVRIGKILTKFSRYWSPDLATVLPGYSTIWCEVDDSFARWCPRTASVTKPCRH